MTAPIFMQRDGTASEPVAKWVGKHHIQYTREFFWRTVRSSKNFNVKTRRIENIRVTTKQLQTSYK